MRVLVVGGDGELADIRHEQPALRHLLAMHVGARGGSLVHHTLAAVSPIHASEVTHIFAAAWRGPGHDLAPSDLSGYGRTFTSLRSVSLAHLTKGTLDPIHPSPAACIKRLLGATARTLRALSIDAPVFFEAGDAVDILPSLGTRLEVRPAPRPHAPNAAAAGHPPTATSAPRPSPPCPQHHPPLTHTPTPVSTDRRR